MKTFIKLYRPILVILWILLGAMFVLGLLLNNMIFRYAGAGMLVFGALLALLSDRHAVRKLRQFSVDLSSILSTEQAAALIHFPMPVLMVLDSGEIAWYNKICGAQVLMNEDMIGKNISEVFGELSFHGGSQPESGISLSYRKKKYTGYIVRTREGETTLNVLYLTDDTELKNYRDWYLRTRITVMMIMIDNYEEILQSARENERTQLVPEIEFAIQNSMKDSGGLLCRIERDKYLVILEETAIQQIISSRFAILDNVRKIEVTQRVPATLSIGVGQHAASLTEAENMSRQALDMALGRGGDQAAVKTQNGYEFYGGVSKGIEKRTKVKTRIVANALTELINGSSNVIIMGHRFSDLDCVGSAVGLCKAVQLLGKPVKIAINCERTLAKPLLERLLPAAYDSIFCDPEFLFEEIDSETLLIIVDVHAKHFLESIELYERCRSVVVIDHHRKMVDYIDNAVIFYHEPYASSASEMISELIQYFGLPKNLGRVEAEALLAGIMLDTKNFVMKAGVRTFEAAAYLKRLGADTVEVRKLFASPMESYQKKAKLVSSATIYRKCAIALSTGMVDGIKLIAPQGADDLLSISGVDASFVLFENEGQIEISARSMGAVNVQVVMEKLGGGGHLNMAAAQLKELEIEDAHQMLLGAIDEYFDNTNPNI